MDEMMHKIEALIDNELEDIPLDLAEKIAQAAYDITLANFREKMLSDGAKAMQRQFPVVSHGTNKEGDWCVNPIPLQVFKRSIKAALDKVGK